MKKLLLSVMGLGFVTAITACSGSGNPSGSGGAPAATSGTQPSGSGGTTVSAQGGSSSSSTAASGGTPVTGGQSDSGGKSTAAGGATSTSVSSVSGGATASGGATTVSGGATGSAGVTSSAGKTGSAGTTGAAGTTAAAGKTGSAGTTAAGGSTATGGSPPPGGSGPCDIYAAGSTPCVAAYSMARVLASAYTGPLYQVRKGGAAKNTGTGGTTQDIGAVGGWADAAAQDTFCGSETCTVSKLYDQSGKGNHLTVAPAGCYTGTASEPDYESNAKGISVKANGHKVYGLFSSAHDGYRNNKTTGMPTGDAAQGIYMVVDGKRANVGCCCCFDFGNASTNNCNGPTGSMNTIFFGFGYWGKGASPGPWFLADLEAGVWAGGSGASNAVNTKNPSMNVDFAFGIVKSNSTNYAIKAGNAQSGDLISASDGPPPAKWNMHGGIVLGIGGDNSNSSSGTFFEGAITAGRPTDATDEAVFKNVQAVVYTK